MKQLVGCLVLGLCLSAVAPASIVYNNGLPNQATADELYDTITAEDFNIATATLLTSFRFWDVEDNLAGAYSGSISWVLYSNAAGTPGSILAQGNAGTAAQITRTQNVGVTCCNGYNEFDNTVDMTASLTSGSLSVGPGVYWLGLYDGPFGNTDTRDFYWETTANNATTSGQFQDQTIVNGDWFTTGQEHAFTISDATVDTSSVPEPGTWWLSLGPAGLALIVRKYRFRSNR